MRIYVLKAELKMDSSQNMNERMKMLGPNLATFQLATWVENDAKPNPKLCEKMEQKSKQKQVGCGVENKGV